MKLLLIEDEVALGKVIQKYLISEGYLCEWVQDVPEAEDKIGVYSYDCILVDITLPHGSGFDLIRLLKNQKSTAGIIIISAKNALDDKLMGLDLGSDDYLAKPFHLPELNSRIKAIMRRRMNEGFNFILFEEIKVVPDSMEIYVNEKPVVLTKKEFDLFMYLLSNKNRVLTKATIAEHLYGDEIDQADTFNFLYSHVKNVRKKLQDSGCQDYIQSVYGIGYKFSKD
ncbi:MAG: response regulator transcription factor [Cytophagales bacterium]|nr:response regulator transcription factor [Cytophagales bacterium]